MPADVPPQTAADEGARNWHRSLGPLDWLEDVTDPRLLVELLGTLAAIAVRATRRIGALYHVDLATDGGERWLTVTEVAQLLRCSVSTVQHLPPDAIPGRRQDRPRGHVFWRERAVRDWLQQQRNVAG